MNPWWKKSVVYQIYPRSFNDSNSDGIGDLQGIIQKLDYLQSLGVDIIWLSPIYRSPNDDNGYDISDYRNIMEEFGTMDDFNELLAGMHQRGLKLVMDLVVNHCSDEHDWFQESRKSKDNPYRDYFIWRPPAADGGPPNNWPSFFGGSAWEYDEQTGEYFLHLFTRRQPDLNWENPKVRAEVYDMMHFWLKKGVDGFRMDVIPLISKRPGLPDKPDDIHFTNFYATGPRLHEFLQEMNREVLSHYDIVTIGEAPGVTAEEGLLYVGKDRKELNMIFHFDHMFIDHGPEGKFDPIPLSLHKFLGVYEHWDSIMGNNGWNNLFLGNHDFPRMVSRFGNDNVYRVESAKLLATLLFTFRGTPTIYQGDEIGTPNTPFYSIDEHRDVEALNMYKIHTEEDGWSNDRFIEAANHAARDHARTPVMWDDSTYGGFTSGEPWIKANPAFPKINVAQAEADSGSVLHYYRKVLKLRKESDVLIHGDVEVLKQLAEPLYGFKRVHEGKEVTVIMNFSDENQSYDAALAGETSWFGNYDEAQKGALRPWEVQVWK